LGHPDQLSIYRRIKISHDPNNLTWAQSAESYGQKLLSSQGWKPGQGLGAWDAKHFNSAAPAIKITYKDDNLGLGASLKSANPEHSRTGLDAFHSLLGRLNSKDEAAVKKLEQRLEDRKLAMWTRGKWGGVMFVPGGLLVQGDKFRSGDDEVNSPGGPVEGPVETPDQKVARKATKAFRKAERRERKEAKLQKRAKGNTTELVCGFKNNEGTDPTYKDAESNQGCDTNSGSFQRTVTMDIENAISTGQKQKIEKSLKGKGNRRPRTADHNMEHVQEGKMVIDNVQLPTPHSECLDTQISTQAVQSSSRNGRHIIRGRNIQAKRMAFADAKMLDEVRSP